ncbi:tyrosine-type recombinase/integrase [Streptomyces sp. NPDC001156]
MLLRRGEILGLRRDAVNLERESLAVERALQRVGGEEAGQAQDHGIGPHRPAPTDRGEDAHRASRATGSGASGGRHEWKEHGLIFTSRIGTPLEPDNLRRSWDPLRKRLGLEIRFHDLRHSAVSLLLDPGCRRASSGRSSVTATLA